MKTRRTKALPQTSDDDTAGKQRPIYVSLVTFDKFTYLREASGLDSDQLLCKLIDAHCRATVENRQDPKGDRPADKNQSLSIKRKQKEEEATVPLTRKQCVKPKKSLEVKQNVDTTNEVLNCFLKKPKDAKTHKSDLLLKTTQLAVVNTVGKQTRSGAAKQHAATKTKTGNPSLEQNQSLAPTLSEGYIDIVASCSNEQDNCAKQNDDLLKPAQGQGGQAIHDLTEQGRSVKAELASELEEKDSESAEHQQSQIALVLLSMSQAPAKPDAADDITGDEPILTEAQTSRQLEVRTESERTEVKGVNSKVESKAFRCEQCPYRTNKRGDMTIHSRIHSGARPYVCKECDASFRQRHHLHYHELTHSNSLNFKCSVCPKSFRTISKLRLHMKTHPHVPQISGRNKTTATRKQKVFKCEQCNYQTSTASDLKKHSNSHSEKNLKCEFCEFTTSWKKNLRIHRMKHTGEKPYTCRDCDFSTRDSHALRRHRVHVHSTDQAFVCEICGSSFAQRKLLTQHQVVHTREKPYKCPHCEYSAGYRSNLRSHLLMHNPKKAFVCEDCGKEFRQKQHLSSHQKNKHSNPSKVYLCQICGYSTAASQSLNSHMRIHSANRRTTKKGPAKSSADGDQTQPDLEHSQNMSTEPSVAAEISDLIATDTKTDEQHAQNEFDEHSYSAHLEHPISNPTANTGVTPAQVQLYALEANRCNPEPSTTDGLTVGSQIHQTIVRLNDQLNLQEEQNHEGQEGLGPGQGVCHGQQGLVPGQGVCAAGEGLEPGHAVCGDQLDPTQRVCGNQEGLDPVEGVCGVQDSLSGPVVHESMVCDEQGNPLFQCDQGMAAVLSHIIPDFNYQP